MGVVVYDLDCITREPRFEDPRAKRVVCGIGKMEKHDKI